MPAECRARCVSTRSDCPLPAETGLCRGTGGRAGRAILASGAAATHTLCVDTDPRHTAESSLKRSLNAVADVSGGAAGAAAGLLLGGPAGAVLGGVVGPALSSLARDMAERTLSRRERARTEATYLYAVETIKMRLEEGLEVRQDGFFFSELARRSPAEELFEAVVTSAQREHEERKIEYLGKLIANLAFEEEIDRSLANLMVRIVKEVTWTQLVLLAAIGDESNRATLPDIEIGKGRTDWQVWGLHEQLNDLCWTSKDLIHGRRTKTPRLGLSQNSLRLREQRLSTSGQLLYNVLELNSLPIDDIADLVDVLCRTTVEDSTEHVGN